MSGPDLRLAPAALGCWGAALACLHGDLRTALVLGCVAAVAAAGLGLWRGPRGGRPHRPGTAARWQAVSRWHTPARWFEPARWRWVVAGGLVGIVCGAAATGARLSARDAPELRALVAERAVAEVELTVRDDPHPARGAVGRPATWVVQAQLERVGAALRTDARVLVLATDPGWNGLLPGQRVRTTVRFGASRDGDLRAAVLSATGVPARLGEAPWAQRAAGGLRQGLQRACEPLDDGPGGLLPGLVVGDTSRLDPMVAQQFTDTGMTHLTAVSGSNVAIVIGCALFLIRRMRAGPRLTAVLCAVAVVGFVILARPSPSVLRAAAMGGVALLAMATGRARSALPALCATVAVLVLADPELAADAGFALSVLATAGLLLLAPGMRDALRRRGVPAGVAEAIAVPTAAQLACAPVVAAISGTVSLIAIPANLLVAPAIAPATLAGVVCAALSPLWPAGAEFAAWAGGWPAWWLVTVAEAGSGVPAGVLPWPEGTAGALLLAGLTVLALIGFRRRTVRRAVTAITLAVVLGALPVRVLAPGWPPQGWLVVACDVGQGDALVLRAGPGSAVVVDAGPEPEPVDGCLRRLGVDAVPLLLISHFHIDHIGGVAGVLRGRPVGAIVTTPWPEPAAGRAAVTREAGLRRVPVSQAPPGGEWTVGDVRLRALPAGELHGTRSDPNNNSLMLLATVRGVDILLTGDSETERQRALLDAHVEVRATVLKVAHHGSPYQDPSFLDAVRPVVALVGVGAGNDYGHPSASVLARLSGHGARVLRTDLDGDVAVVLSGGVPAVVVRGK